MKTTGTHVSMDGTLTKLKEVYYHAKDVPYQKGFIGYGKLVYPSRSYEGCPVVALYKVEGGFVALV